MEAIRLTARPETPRPLTAICIPPEASIREALGVARRGAVGVVIVCDPDGRVAGVLADADLRRALLRGTPADAPCVLAVNGNGRRGESVTERGFAALVLAGGLGSRLRPLTDELPKPMLPIDGRPLLELIVEQLRDAGARRVHLATHYRAETIAHHFGDGCAFGVELRYLFEEEPRGTAGAVALLDDDEEALLVMNGDILTDLDLRAVRDFHRAERADLTVAMRSHELVVPYGVLQTDGTAVTGIREKPLVPLPISAGIYVLGRDARSRIPAGRKLDMPDFIQDAVEAGLRVVAFPVVEDWLDVGRPDEYRRATEARR